MKSTKIFQNYKEAIKQQFYLPLCFMILAEKLYSIFYDYELQHNHDRTLKYVWCAMFRFLLFLNIIS